MEYAPAWDGGMSFIWKDGQFVDADTPQFFHTDGGFSNGLAVFDSMLAQDNVLLDAREHFDRLVHDAQFVLGLSMSFLPAYEQMTEAWMPLLTQNKLTHGNARIRTTVTGGISDKPLGTGQIPTIVITATASGAAGNLPPISCAVITAHPRVVGDKLESCKRADYTRSFAARRKAQEFGAEEAILTNTKGDIACGATSNLFIQEKDFLVTPPLTEGVLAGITRAKILKMRKCREEPISERRLRDADAVYLTNSFFGMRKATLKA